MNLIDETQSVLVEVGGIAVFIVGIYALGGAGGIVTIEGLDLKPIHAFVAIVVGLYLMGYKKFPGKLAEAASKLR